MTSSDDRFREMFYEEARELLIGLEEGLMDLERRQGDRAHIDRTFRAAHSLKGAAAMVGLASIAEFTHGIEAVLEKIRSGSLGVDSDIITTLLEARDHLAAMVEGEAAESSIPGSGDLTHRLNALLGVGPGARAPGTVEGPSRPLAVPATAVPTTAPAISDSRSPASENAAPVIPSTPQPASEFIGPGPESKAVLASAPPAQPPVVEVPPVGPASLPAAASGSKRRKSPTGVKSGKSKTRSMAKDSGSPPAAEGTLPLTPGPAGGERNLPPIYRIMLAPGPETLRRGVNPLGVLDELAELGETAIVPNLEALPDLDDLDPERCYVSWTITVRTDAAPERIGDVFLFVAEDSKVQVERMGADGSFEAVAGAAPTEPAASAKPTPAAASTEPLHPTTDGPAPGLVVGVQVDSPAMVPAHSNGDGPVPLPAAPGSRGTTVHPAPAGARHHSRIRVDAAQLDELVELAGELAVLSDNLQGLREVPGISTWIHALESLERVSRQVRDTTLDLRMVPVDELFSRFPRVVRDLADRSGKEIELRIVGQETRLDRTIVERLNDPLIHLVRNAVDHALETPQERIDRGKPRGGRITLTAGHEGDRVAIRVEDDGKGLDREKIVRKGIARGMVPVGTSPEDPRVIGLIFEPGFSTREQVSELSGRGVGLDVVRDSVRSLRGTLAVESVPGRGTSFIFRLPLTLALIDGLLIETAGGKYVVPLSQVEECVSLNGTRPALAQERPCVSVRGELVPTISLRSLFQSDGPLPARQELLLTRHSGQRVGVAVDRLVGRVQAVIQSLGQGMHGLGRFSGATILGDGSVSLILDLSALVSESRIAEHGVRTTPSNGVRAEALR